MRTLLAMFVGLSGALPGLAQDDPTKVRGYWPLKVGARWHYAVDLNGMKSNMIQEVTKIEKINDVELARLETVMNGMTVATEHLRETDKGIFRHRFADLDSTPPAQLARYPVKKGDTWSQDITIGRDRATLKGKVRLDEVTVPAGKYEALVVKLETEVMGQKIETTYWFAPGVGVVKQQANVAGIAILMELEKFDAGK